MIKLPHKVNLRLILFSIIALAITATCVATFLPILNKPFTLDETEESLMGWKIGTVGPRTFHPVEEGGEGMPITHSLLYTFSHGLVQRIFGHNEFPVRAYGMFQYLVSLFFVFLIMSEILKGDRFLKRCGIAIAAALYLLNPLLVQHSVVVNTDNNILTTSILAFMYFFIRFEKTKTTVTSRVILALLLAISFWAKETTPVFVVFGILMYRLLKRGRKQFLMDLVVTCIGGIAIFWFSWWLYCFFTKTDVLGFVKFTIVGKSKLAFSLRYLKYIPETWLARFRWPVYWVSAPFFIALVVLMVKRARRVFLDKKTAVIDFVFITAACIWIPYYFFKPNMDMMKYQYPSYPLFIILIAWMFTDVMTHDSNFVSFAKSVRKMAFLFAFLIAITLYYYKMGDYILALWKPMYQHLNSHFLLYYYLPLLAVVPVIAVFSKKREIYNHTIAAIILFIIPISAALGLNQAKADYNTAEIYLNYGERGFADTVDYLAKNLEPGSLLSARHDIYYYLTTRKGVKISKIYVPEDVLSITDLRKMDLFLMKLPFKYVVLHRILKFIPIPKESFVVLNRYYYFKKQIGDFYIYERRVS